MRIFNSSMIMIAALALSACSGGFRADDRTEYRSGAD